jgi:hypothetical protein
MCGEHGKISGRCCAVTRFADALLRSFGGTAVTLRLANASSGDTKSQIGLETPIFEDVEVSPAVIQTLAPAEDGRRRAELALSTSSLRRLALNYGIEDVSPWLLGMRIVLRSGEVMRIESVAAEQFAGTDCIYHLTATE